MENKDLVLKLLGCLLDANNAQMSKSNETYLQIGKSYHIRTVTYATAGKLKAITKNEFVFESASWVADTGRFNEYIKDTSRVKENEYIGEIIVNRDAVVDVIEIDKAHGVTV